MKLKPGQKLAYYYALLFSVPRMAKIHLLLLKTALRGIGVLNYYDSVVSGENYFVSNILPFLAQKEKSVFFDVGANQGAYSMLLARKFPNAKIFAYEPHPKNYQILKKLEINNFYPFALALSDSAGSKLLYDFADDDGSTNASLHKDVFSDIRHKETKTHYVKVDTLDSVVRSLKIDQIDLLKIDTEGNELAVLAGGKFVLQQERIGAVQFEFNEMNIVSHSFFYDFRKLLGGYSMFRLLPKGLLHLTDTPLYSELFGYQNILAIPKSKIQNLQELHKYL